MPIHRFRTSSSFKITPSLETLLTPSIETSLLDSSVHLEAFIAQGSSVEGLLIGWLQFQCCITVLFGLCKPLKLQVAQSSVSKHMRHL